MSAEETVLHLSGDIDTKYEENDPNKFIFNLTHLNIPLQIPETKQWIVERKQNMRPWLVFVQTSNFKTPQSVTRLYRRIVRNFEYFLSNYLCILLAITAYALITSPTLLLCIAFSVYVHYKLSKRKFLTPVMIFKHELTHRQMHLVVQAMFLPIFYYAGIGQAFMWSLSASLIVILLHATFYNIDGLVTEPEDAFGLTQEV